MFFYHYKPNFFNFWWLWKEPFAMMALMTTTYLSRCSVWPPPASVHNCSLFPNYYTATHTAHPTQDWLTQDCSDFLRKGDWPPNSPDLNPLHFYIVGAMLHQYEQYNPKPKPAKINWKLFWEKSGITYQCSLSRELCCRLERDCSCAQKLADVTSSMCWNKLLS